jgi:hypothetical protein
MWIQKLQFNFTCLMNEWILGTCAYANVKDGLSNFNNKISGFSCADQFKSRKLKRNIVICRKISLSCVNILKLGRNLNQLSNKEMNGMSLWS